MPADLRRATDALRHARLRPTEWDEVRRALDSGDTTELHRLAFESKVHRRAAAKAARSPLAGKGSPSSLITIGLISTAILGGAAWSLGGGLLFLPALIPALTIATVFAARWANDRSAMAARAALASGAAASGGIAAPADVRTRLDVLDDNTD
jgi:hypothetical protein